jgi:hypothetical protein
MTGPVGVVRMSYTVMTFGWDSAATALASRSSRCCSWAASAVGVPGGYLMSLIATRRSSTWSVAAHTVPMAPSPIIVSSRYRPASQYRPAMTRPPAGCR